MATTVINLTYGVYSAQKPDFGREKMRKRTRGDFGHIHKLNQEINF